MTFTIEIPAENIKQAYQEGFRHGFSEGMRTQLSAVWIPVDRRLPRYNTPVLISCGERVEIAWYGNDDMWHDGQCGIDSSEVVAWLTLPDHYSGEL